ncbi:MAG: threonylcarbamoyl-AMP synthase [Deltaproteobacteria bacterium]|nr:threonylcarbamoyl-AMP synthase [Deltaproteobacteria bacterium]
MKSIPAQDLTNDSGNIHEIARLLKKGGLVCFPSGGSYRLGADLTSSKAVSRLLQSKRRIGKAPSLAFISSYDMLKQVAAGIPEKGARLVKNFWPGELTLLVEPSPNLPAKVVKQLTMANGRLGVRVPCDKIARSIVEKLGRPLLVSSANVASKKGSESAAQVIKNFMGKIDIFVNAGDLKKTGSSTVVRLKKDSFEITRPGMIEKDELEQAWGD